MVNGARIALRVGFCLSFALLGFRAEMEPLRRGPPGAQRLVLLTELGACAGRLILALAGVLLFEELADGWSSFLASSFALFAKSLRGDDPLLAVEVPLDPALETTDLCPFLPKRVGGMALVWCDIGLVHTWALDEVTESSFIGPFVDVASTLGAFKIACRLCILMFMLTWWLGLLLSKDVLDVLCPGDFFGQWFSLAGWCRADVLDLQLWTFFTQALLQYIGGESLTHAGPTGHALIATSMRLPSMMGVGPWLFALVDEVLLALFGVFALMSWCFGADVVSLVPIDLGQSFGGMLVDERMISVKSVLPFTGLFVM